MCPPGLHITLGIFFRLLLEDECHELDLVHAIHGAQTGPSYERYIAALWRKRNIEEDIRVLRDYMHQLDQLVTLASIALPNPTTNVQYRNLCAIVATKKHRVQELVSRHFLS